MLSQTGGIGLAKPFNEGNPPPLEMEREKEELLPTGFPSRDGIVFSSFPLLLLLFTFNSDVEKESSKLVGGKLCIAKTSFA